MGSTESSCVPTWQTTQDLQGTVAARGYSQPGVLNEAQQPTAAANLGFEMGWGVYSIPSMPLHSQRAEFQKQAVDQESLSGWEKEKAFRTPKGSISATGHKETHGWLLFITEVMKPKGSYTEPTIHIISVYWAQKKMENELDIHSM